MTAPRTSDPRRPSAFGRAFAALTIAAMIFILLWMFVVTATTAALIGFGAGAVIFATAQVSDIVETLLDLIASAVLAVLAIFGAILGALFSFWN